MPPSQWENLAGGYFVGVVFSSIILGVVTVQAWIYYREYPEDRMVYKFLIGILWALPTFQLVASTLSMYTTLIGSFGILALQATWYNTIYQIITVFLACIVQFFFVYRLYALSKSIMLPLLVATITLTQLGLGLGTFIQVNKLQIPLDAVHSLRPIVIAWLSTEAFADLLIAAAMSFFLRMRRTGLPQTDTVIKILIYYAINTGLLTSMIAIEVMVMFALFGFQFTHECFIHPLGGIYAVSLLANLNSRSTLRRKLKVQSGQFVRLSRLPERYGETARSTPAALHVNADQILSRSPLA